MATRVWALCGYPGTGKDEIARYLQEQYGWQRIAFADPMRRALYALNPLVVDSESRSGVTPLADLVDEYGWDMVKRAYPGVREYLQRMGTEAGREIHGTDCWTRLAVADIRGTVGSVVITDLRFENELDVVRSLGGVVIHVVRPGVGSVNSHASEQMDYTAAADLGICNEGDLSDLRRSVDLVLAMTARGAK